MYRYTNMSRYDSYYKDSENNKLINPLIKEGKIITYFNHKGSVTIEEINYDLGIVRYQDEFKFRWWDYFMDANYMVLEY